MPIPERSFAVLLYGREVGRLQQRGAFTRFYFSEEYLGDPHRPLLGLYFEENPAGQKIRRMRLPPWFSNLLPEERLRRWVAAQRDVPLDREVDIIAEVGHDLPGAVEVRPVRNSEGDALWPVDHPTERSRGNVGEGVTKPRFSLAGVTMKFSMIRVGERLTLPAVDERGDWIVKLPDEPFPRVPQNECAMMSFAHEVGLDVPEVEIRHRDELPRLPDHLWPRGEEYAYAVRRFDRDSDRKLIHIEDLAQARGYYPENKYDSNFETMAGLIFRGHDVESLREFARRFTFNVIIGNADAHLKNWSLIYRDRRRPTLAPGYDLVATVAYGYVGLGLPWLGRTELKHVQLSDFAALEQLLGAEAGLVDVARDTVQRAATAWPTVEGRLADAPLIRDAVAEHLKAAVRQLS